MAIAHFKDLCLDANDASVAAPFWAAVLGLAAEYKGNGDAVLRGPNPAQTLWINRVAEPKAVKHRVHLDVHAGSVAEVEALGARRLSAEGDFRWTVLADPEGGDFCVFEREKPGGYRLYEVVVDCVDPISIARWWAGALGATLTDHDGYASVDAIPEAPFDAMSFVPVPEPKTVKNRIHWDVVADDVEPLVAAGAVVLRERDDEIRWTVMADPDGNEFCVFTGERVGAT